MTCSDPYRIQDAVDDMMENSCPHMGGMEPGCGPLLAGLQLLGWMSVGGGRLGGFFPGALRC